MHSGAATKETFFAPETPKTGEIYSFIETHSARRGFAPEPKFFLSGGDAGDQVEIPHEVYEVLVKTVDAMRSGLAVTITPSSHTLTTQKAAELLGVSRPTFVKMLETGRIPFEKPGTHRRVQLADLLAFNEERKAEQYAALSSMETVDDELPIVAVDRMKVARKEAAKRRRSSKS
ncbi:helix-turn-helix domain-containing protein [Paeniglutamicibacter sp.]|uniref:helix-turn-helix domain-containing protein n=1 Tax=Paeniglutamicibacter sp. TaxID=1934391 RepID=UPI003989F52E